MKRKISFLLVLTLILLPLSFSYAEGNHDIKDLEKYASELDKSINDLINKNRQTLDNNKYINENNNIKPSHVEHHTCFRGGTECAHCHTYAEESVLCDCIIYLYKCCCGAVLGGKTTYCKYHR